MRIVALALFLLPGVAIAHPGDHSAAPWWHMLTQPDHLGLAVMVSALALVIWARWRA